jgi:hypothetical protein
MSIEFVDSAMISEVLFLKIWYQREEKKPVK